MGSNNIIYGIYHFLVEGNMQKSSSSSQGKYIDFCNSFDNKVKTYREEATLKRIAHYQDSMMDYKKSFYSNTEFSHNNQQLKPVNNKTTRMVDSLVATIPLYVGLKEGLSNPFQLFVVGTGNYGKSTLINSLLGTGEKHAAENTLPETWKIDIFEKNINFNEAIIQYRDGREVKLPKNEVESILKDEEQKRKASNREVRKKLKESTDLDKEAFKELKLKLEREELYTSPIIEVHWGIKGSEILNQFSIVDTPGFIQTVMGEVRNSVKEYYHKSDGVLWLLDATSISASGSMKLISELEDTLKEIGGRRIDNNIIAVLNRIDLVDKNEGDAQKVIAEANRIYGNYFEKIVPFSAKLAFEAQMENDEIKMKKSGLDKLRNEINNTFFMNAKDIQCNKKDEACSVYSYEIRKKIETYHNDLNQDKEKLIKVLDRVEMDMQNERKTIKDSYKQFLNSYFNTVLRNIDTKLSILSDIEDKEKQKEYLIKEIFMEDYLKSETKLRSERSKNKIIDLMIINTKQHNFTEYKHLSKYNKETQGIILTNSHQASHDYDLMVPKAMKVGFASGAISGLFFGGAVGLIVGGVAWFAAKKIKESLINQLVGELESVYNANLETFESYMDELYHFAYSEINNTICESLASIYELKMKKDDIKGFTKNINAVLKDGYTTLHSIDNEPSTFYPSAIEIILNN